MPKTFDEMFPAPIHAQYFLWAGHWEQMEEGNDMDAMLWSHPGHEIGDDPEEAVCTTEEAMQIALDYVGLLLASAALNDGTQKAAVSRDIIEEIASRYHGYMMDNDLEYRRAIHMERRIKELTDQGLLPPQSPAPSFVTAQARQLELY